MEAAKCFRSNRETLPPLTIEAGSFGLLALGLLIPAYWPVHLLTLFCYCCCSAEHGFFEGNLYRLVGLAAGMLVCLSLDSWRHRRWLAQRGEALPLSEILTGRVAGTATLTLMTLATLARPGYGMLYAGAAGLSLIIHPPSHPLWRKLCAAWLLGVILLPMALIVLPAMACDCSKVSSVKANMHTLQTLLEMYAADHQGQYPPNLATLQRAAETGKYWKSFANPYTGKTGNLQAFGDDIQLLRMMQAGIRHPEKPLYHEMLGIRWYPADYYKRKKAEGLVLFASQGPHAYRIYGFSLGGELIRDKGQPFVLLPYA